VSFCGEQANVSKILHQFFNLLKRGGKFQKTGDDTMFYFRPFVFPKKNYAYLRIFWEKKQERKQKQKIS